MIISHKYRYIFIKTRKTGGTSLEIALGRHCSHQDILTPIYEADARQYQHTPQNYNGYFNHITARDIRNRVPDAIWSSYTKFTVERNPWDKMVSMYWWRKHQYAINDNFQDFVTKAIYQPNEIYTAPSDFYMYSIDDNIITDYVIQFENLDSGYETLSKHLKIEGTLQLPHAKGSFRKENTHYSAYYTDELRSLVADFFRREINYFGYQFQLPAAV